MYESSVFEKGCCRRHVVTINSLVNVFGAHQSGLVPLYITE